MRIRRAAGGKRGPYAVGALFLVALAVGGSHLITTPEAALVEQTSVGALAEPSASATTAADPVNLQTPHRSQGRVTARPATPPPSTKRAVPTRLLLPRLGVSMPVEATRLNPQGQMRMPDRPGTIGWYAYGPAPGSGAGSAVLAGHVDSRQYGVGPLVKLSQSKVGDRVVVESARGQQTFVVEHVQLLAKHGLDDAALFARTGPSRLRVVTCGGAYLPEHGGYQDNVVVTATVARR